MKAQLSPPPQAEAWRRLFRGASVPLLVWLVWGGAAEKEVTVGNQYGRTLRGVPASLA